MTRYAFAVDPPILFAYPFIGPGGESFPSNFIELASPSLRTSKNIKAVVEDPAPGGKYIVSETITLDATVPTAHSVFADIPPAPVPVSITNYQVARQLISMGPTNLAATQTLIDNNTSPNATAAAQLKAYFARESVFYRDNENVEALRVLLGMTQGDMDDFFTAASGW